jgi:hypothetical protein
MSRHQVGRTRRAAIALLIAVASLSAPFLAAPATAFSCTVTPKMVTYPGVVSAKVKWGPNCNTGYAFTMSVWNQTGPTDWLKLWQENFPNISNTGGNYYDMLHGWYCGGVGVFKARAQVGGLTVWSATVHCPPDH